MERQKQTGTVKPRSDFVLGLILEIAAAATVEISEETQAIYLRELSTLSDEALKQAARRTIREWPEASKMPPIAFILARAQENQQVLAEAAWETLQKLIYRDWHPDVGWSGKKPELSAAMEYAIRQCGGLHRIHDCHKDNFNFLRRDFIAAHSRFSAEGGEQVRLSHKQAAEILGQLQRKELPS